MSFRFFVPSVFAIALCAMPSLSSADIIVMSSDDVGETERAQIVSQIQKVTGQTARTTTPLSSPIGEVAPTEPPAEARKHWQNALSGYRRLDLDQAVVELQSAKTICLDAELFLACRNLLFDVELLIGAIAMARGDKPQAEISFRTAHAMNPERVVDPGLFPPPVVREFGIACARIDSLPMLQLTIESKPAGARLFLNGRPCKSAVNLPSGRHVLTAEYLGYHTGLKTVEVDATGGGPPLIRFNLDKLDETEAWQWARARLSEGITGLGDVGVDRLLERFGIDRVIFVEFTAQKLQLFVATPGSTRRVAMPSIATSAEIDTPGFRQPLFNALGIPLPAPPPEVVLPAAPASEKQVDDRLSEAQVEATPIPTKDELPALQKPSVVRSPWFWTAIGVAGAIITTVVVVMAVD